MVAPAGLMAMRKVADVAARLATAIVETTAEVKDGTVYRVVSVVADGALCPKTLYTVGT